MAQSVYRDLVQAVAEEKETAPEEVDPHLQKHIALDAVALLACHENTSWILQFDLPDTTVTVTSDGDSSVMRLNQELHSRSGGQIEDECTVCNTTSGERYSLGLEEKDGGYTDIEIRLCEACASEILAFEWVTERNTSCAENQGNVCRDHDR